MAIKGEDEIVFEAISLLCSHNNFLVLNPVSYTDRRGCLDMSAGLFPLLAVCLGKKILK